MGLSDFLTQTATISPRTGQDELGAATLGAAVSVDCKFTRITAFESDSNNGMGLEENVPDATMFVRESVDAEPEYGVVFDSVKYEIIEVIHRVGTATSLRHKQLLLKKFS